MEREVAEKAARWWADQLRGHAKLDNEDDSQTGVMFAAMALLLQAQEESGRNPSDADRFEAVLTDALCERDGDWITVGCDYGPDRFLSQIAEKAEVRLGMTSLPWKTIMSISGAKVSVRCGYGAESVEL